MNPNDETLLTAYLDGELDERRCQAIERALCDDPRLADRLRDLTAVHELVAGLPRPAIPVDVTGAIMTRLPSGRPGDRSPRRRWPALTLGLGLSAAAALAIALIPTWFGPSGRPVRRHQLAQGPAKGDRPGGLSTTVAGTEAQPVPSSAGGSSRAEGGRAERPGEAEATLAFVPGPDEDERQTDLARRRVLDLLDQPDVRRIFITVDHLEPAADEVDQVLRTLPRLKPRFGKLTVNQGIVVDPENPRAAVVFILVMDDHELSEFRSRLHREPSIMEIAEAESPPPSVATLLADIGQVDVLEGTRAARLISPPADLAARVALRTEVLSLPKDRLSGASSHLPEAPSTPDSGTALQAPAEALAEARGPEPGRPGPAAPAAKPNRPVTVVVWVTAREADRAPSGRN